MASLGSRRTVAIAPHPQGLALPLLFLVVAAVAMGVSPVFVRVVSPEVGPFASAFWRVFLALPLLYAWARWEERDGRRAGRPGLPSLLAGLAFSGDLFFWHLAVLGTTVANATFFATTAPVFVVALSWLVFRVRPGPTTLGALALCLLGGAALIGDTVRIAPDRMAGDLYGVATAFFFGAYFVAVQRARRDRGTARVTFETSVVTAAVLLIPALAFDADRFLPADAGGWAALFALSWVSHAGGQGLLTAALGRLPVVFSSLVIFLEAVVAAAAGALLLRESLSPMQVAGGALILLGIWTGRPRPTAAAAARVA